MTAPRDRGSASIWVLSCAVLLLAVAFASSLRATAVVARHRAESAADLAALAGAGRIGASGPAGGVCSAAASTAARNGAHLRSCESSIAADGRSGTVRARVTLRIVLPIVGGETVVAQARAARLPAGP